MANLNKVLLIGNIGRDAELKYSANGIPVSSFPLAVNKVYKNQNGEKQEKTTWVNIVLFGKTAESLHQYLLKGKLVYVEGELNLEKYTDKDGIERYSTKAIGRLIQFLGTKKDGSEPDINEPVETNTEPPADVQEDDVPF
jgi:single-strand DNA-binding protein